MKRSWDMRAMQSSTALELVESSGQFAALWHLSREMSVASGRADAAAEEHSAAAECEPVAAAGVAEGLGLAHDAGNLLGALRLYSDLLGRPGVLSDEHREYASELRLLSERSWAMIDRLVNHVQREQKTRLAEETSVLPEVMEQCGGLLSRVAGRAVEIVYGAGAYEPVSVPAEAVERIVTNLVKNAAEASHGAGAISVEIGGEAEADGRRRVRLAVRDRGCGMDESMVAWLMQGGSAGSGSSKGSGRGLGFRVVRELVALSGGCLSVESKPEMGTSVSAEWYAATAEAPCVEGPFGVKERAGDRRVWKEAAGWIAC